MAYTKKRNTIRRKMKGGGFFTKNYNKKLDKAVRIVDLEGVKSALKKGANVDTADKWGETALMWASKWGELELVRLLLQNGAEVDAQDSLGATALHHATMWDRTEVVTELLKEAGADVNMKDKHNKTPLDWAKEHEKFDMVNLLESVGALSGAPRPPLYPPRVWQRERHPDEIVFGLKRTGSLEEVGSPSALRKMGSLEQPDLRGVQERELEAAHLAGAEKGEERFVNYSNWQKPHVRAARPPRQRFVNYSDSAQGGKKSRKSRKSRKTRKSRKNK